MAHKEVCRNYVYLLIKTLNRGRVKNRMGKRSRMQLVIAEIACGSRKERSVGKFKLIIRKEQANYLLTLLAAGRRRLFLAFLCQLLLQAAFTIAVQLWLIPVLAKVFGYVIFLCIIAGHYYHLAEGLQQYAHQGYYGKKLFQKGYELQKVKLQENVFIA